MMANLVKEINKGKEAEEIIINTEVKIIRVNGFDITVEKIGSVMNLWGIKVPFGEPVKISCISEYATSIPGMYERVPENLLMFVLSELER